MTISADERPAFAFRARSSMRALRLNAAGQPLPTREVARIIVKGASTRLVFTWAMALLAAAALPLWLTVLWAFVVTCWELALRPLLDRFVALPLARRSERHGLYSLAAVNLVGGCIYAAFPLVAYQTDTAIGLIFATAWICAAASHDFVYFSSHRLLLAAALTPLVLCALTAPFVTTGLSIASGVAAMIWLAMILTAGFYGRDRVFLTEMLAKQAVSRAAAEQANTAKSRFLATMSHELRTPLNAIIGYAELIEEDADAAARKDAGNIRASARQLLSVINTILDVSRLEAGGIELQLEHFQVADVLEQVRESALPLAAQNQNALHMEAGAELGDMVGDHVRLHQSIMQLVSNAAKFTRNGDIFIGASRSTVDGADVIRFKVKDTGIGIAQEQQSSIFEPFVQIDSDHARRYDGAGLGLSLARRIAKLMGGDIACESTPGAGSTFTLWVRANPQS